MAAFLDGEIIVAFITLAALEIVLGIDNIIFLSIMASKLPPAQQPRARTLGLAGAMLTRILLLLSVAWLAQLTNPWFTIFGDEISGRDLILIAGGAFLIYKAGRELVDQALGGGHDEAADGKAASFIAIVVQIMLLDIVFSLDSVITAVGMTTTLMQHGTAVPVMITAIVAAIAVMMFFSSPVSRFIEANPRIKTLALAFLLMIGGVLVADGLDRPVSTTYVYVAIGFSLVVELLNMWIQHRRALAARLGPRRRYDD